MKVTKEFKEPHRICEDKMHYMDIRELYGVNDIPDEIFGMILDEMVNYCKFLSKKNSEAKESIKELEAIGIRQFRESLKLKETSKDNPFPVAEARGQLKKAGYKVAKELADLQVENDNLRHEIEMQKAELEGTHLLLKEKENRQLEAFNAHEHLLHGLYLRGIIEDPNNIEIRDEDDNVVSKINKDNFIDIAGTLIEAAIEQKVDTILKNETAALKSQLSIANERLEAWKKLLPGKPVADVVSGDEDVSSEPQPANL
jgi:hypothetical protein